MAEPMPVTDEDVLGPMDYLAVEFAGGRITGDGFGVLLDLVDRGAVRILDLEFVAKASDGSVDVLDIAGLDTEPGLDLSPFVGASSGILDRSDLDEVGGAITSGSVAVVLVYEELVTLPLVAAWQRGGARVIAEGQISAEDIVLALDATESS
ncbi:MAG TPA: DUF6325 family protein [Nakamurella sp.]